MMQQPKRNISVAFQSLSIIPETQKHGSELKELTTPLKQIFYSHRNLGQKEE